jgi:hypothetical protein
MWSLLFPRSFSSPPLVFLLSLFVLHAFFLFFLGFSDFFGFLVGRRERLSFGTHIVLRRDEVDEVRGYNSKMKIQTCSKQCSTKIKQETGLELC